MGFWVHCNGGATLGEDVPARLVDPRHEGFVLCVGQETEVKDLAFAAATAADDVGRKGLGEEIIVGVGVIGYLHCLGEITTSWQ